jgi:hypothetical protein
MSIIELDAVFEPTRIQINDIRLLLEEMGAKFNNQGYNKVVHKYIMTFIFDDKTKEPTFKNLQIPNWTISVFDIDYD